MTITAELRRMHSPDVLDLKNFSPAKEEAFGILVQAMFGSKEMEGEESFDIVVCTPEWLRQRMNGSKLYSGRHHLICSEFNFDALSDYLKRCAKEAAGADWKEIAIKLARVGKWEFEDYS
jgi:hypothetical protein